MGFCCLVLLNPGINHDSNRREGVTDVTEELGFPLEPGDIEPVVAGLTGWAGVAERSKMHDGGGLAMAAPELGFSGQIACIKMSPLGSGRVCAEQVLVKSLGQGRGRAVAVEPQPTVFIDNGR